MKMEADVGLMLLQARELQGGQHIIRSYGRSMKQIFPSLPSEGTGGADTLISDSSLQNYCRHGTGELPQPMWMKTTEGPLAGSVRRACDLISGPPGPAPHWTWSLLKEEKTTEAVAFYSDVK